MGLAKAYLELVETTGPNPPSSASGTKIEFQFNPSQIKLSRSAFWRPVRTNVRGAPTSHEYKGPKPTSLSLEMFLDASYEENGDVSGQVDDLLEACAPTERSAGAGTPLPKFAIFGWDRVYFRGFIEKVDVTYTMFRETGKPVRATCSIQLTETPPGRRGQNPSSKAAGAQGAVQLVDGDTLAGLAYREYGDPSLWRLIAEANFIDDPIRVRPGMRLVIPSRAAGKVEEAVGR